ncbi:hypothetical protein B9Z65_2737 [Elsinoe australis]|uniref:Uncharacterized protein n=1 Tax=Elsinoe australis TaxID=40998 RepID=A0A2P8A4I8_9PEZI|nr:hypothetical protein B9Z65_2737 [Elsinoe australis]
METQEAPGVESSPPSSMTTQLNDFHAKKNAAIKNRRHEASVAHRERMNKMRQTIQAVSREKFLKDGGNTEHIAQLQRLSELLQRKQDIEAQIDAQRLDLQAAYNIATKAFQVAINKRLGALQTG